MAETQTTTPAAAPAAKPTTSLGDAAAIVKQFEVKPLATLQTLFETFSGQIANALPKHMTPERMIRVALTSVSTTPKLQLCDPFTICGAVVQSSILGLEPSGLLGEAFLVPYKNNKRTHPVTKKRGVYECQLQVGYKGHVKLARNSGEIAMVDAQIVHENDEFDFDKGMNPVLLHKWAKRGQRGLWIGSWAGFRLKDGTFNFEYMTTEEIEAHRDRYSKSRDFDTGQITGPWIEAPEWMFKKTVLIKVLKLAPKSVHLATAIGLQEAAEANMQQKFTIDVPLEFQPPPEDIAEGDEPPAAQLPQRKTKDTPAPEQASLTPANTQGAV